MCERKDTGKGGSDRKNDQIQRGKSEECELRIEVTKKELMCDTDWGSERHQERDIKGMLSTPISPQRVRRVQSSDKGHCSVFSFRPNIIHPTDMPKTPEQCQTAYQATKNKPSVILRCCNRHSQLKHSNITVITTFIFNQH